METKKYVRIKKASESEFWYADKIGEIFRVVEVDEFSYRVDFPGLDVHLPVSREDAEVIVTEKRKATVGERVLITDMEDSELRWARYRNYDVGVVREETEYGGHAYCNINGYSGVLVLRGEYEVIVENEEADDMKIDLNAMGYDELLAHGDAVMEAIKKRTFQEGFRAGKQVQRKLAEMNAEKTAQARRDEIVEQAKADIEALKTPGRMVNGNTSDYKVDLFGANAEFIVNREKRTVVALLKGAYSGTVVLARGIAKAAPSDCFNVHIGRAIALRRALGLAVPDEYLNAPQPTEVRVGDVVEGWAVKDTALVISDDAWPPISDAWLPLKYARQYELRIIDDSREEVGE